jgi:hypothetical protein
MKFYMNNSLDEFCLKLHASTCAKIVPKNQTWEKWGKKKILGKVYSFK